MKGGIHAKSDERILGESAFVSDILSQANERYERRHELKRLGYDLSRVAEKVSEIYDIDADDILSKGKQQKKVKARSLLCYWAVNELGCLLQNWREELVSVYRRWVTLWREDERFAGKTIFS